MNDYNSFEKLCFVFQKKPTLLLSYNKILCYLLKDVFLFLILYF